jgi:Tfp pilus assembly protein PilX
MSLAASRGGVLLVGLLLLALISSLALAAASAAHVELQLARNEQFRENAASAASAGIESAISRIVSSATSDSALAGFRVSLPAMGASCEVSGRLIGYETGLPQAPGANLVAAHIEIIATGHAQRGAYDRQRAIIRQVAGAPDAVRAMPCEPLAPGVPCAEAGQWRRISWQRLPRE